MNTSERSQLPRDPQQIIFVMLNRFGRLSKKFLFPLFLMDNIKLDGMPTNIKLKTQAYLTLHFKFWEGASVKRYKIQLSVLLFLVLLYISRYHFFYTQIFLFKPIHPNLLNSQDPLVVTKPFSQFSLKCFLKYFFAKIY